MSDTQKHTKPNVPNLRFPEFSGEWEEHTIGDYIKIQGGYAYKSEAFRDNGIPIIRISNLPQNSNTVDLSDCVYYDDGPYTNYIVNDGDLLIAMSGATTGKTAIYCSLRKAFLNQRVGCFKSIGNIYYPILYALVQSPAFQSQLGKKLIAGAQPNISSADIETIRVNLPSSNEQEKIASFMNIIDQRIAIQSKVIEKYESLIKALAYEIIGKKKATTVLADLVNCSASILKESDLNKNSWMVPTYGASGLSGYTDVCLSERDSILITKDGSGVGSLRYVSGKHSFVGTLNSLTPKEGIYLPYIYYALFCVNFDTYKTGQAIPHIYFKDYGKEPIYCPAYDDQKRLAKRLELLDAKIGIERAVLRNLQSAKAFLLSGMFI